MKNEEIIKELKPFERWFEQAVKANYISSMTIYQVQSLIDIAKNIGIDYTHRGCPKCLFDFVKKVGLWYYNNKDIKPIEDNGEKKEKTNAKKPKKKS